MFNCWLHVWLPGQGWRLLHKRCSLIILASSVFHVWESQHSGKGWRCPSANENREHRECLLSSEHTAVFHGLFICNPFHIHAFHAPSMQCKGGLFWLVPTVTLPSGMWHWTDEWGGSADEGLNPSVVATSHSANARVKGIQKPDGPLCLIPGGGNMAWTHPPPPSVFSPASVFN